MMFDRWRARRALMTRASPSTIEDRPHERLTRAVNALKAELECENSLGDPLWHHRWNGPLELVGLDASERSVSDVRQRLLRLVHEMSLRHLSRAERRVLAVIRCAPREGEDLDGWHARLQEDRGEVGVGDWRAARRWIAVLAVDPNGRAQLFGGDDVVRGAVTRWNGSPGARTGPDGCQ